MSFWFFLSREALYEHIDYKINRYDKKADEKTRLIVQDELKRIHSGIPENQLDQITIQLNSEISNIVSREISTIQRDFQERLNKQNQVIRDLQSVIKGLNDTLSLQQNQLKTLKSELDELKNIVKIDIKSPNSPPQLVLFPESSRGCDETLGRFLTQAETLRRKIENLSIGEEKEICIKLTDNCIRKISALKDKNATGSMEAEKVARKTRDILMQTLCKIMAKERVRPLVVGCFLDCGIKKLNWNVGRKLNDSDFSCLAEPILWEKVQDRAKNDTIIEVLVDGYILEYEEDGKYYETVIPGMYRIGRYELRPAREGLRNA